MRARLFHVKSLGVAMPLLASCVSVTGPCTVTTRTDVDGAHAASVECEQGGSASIAAPSRAIEAIGGAASGARP